MSDFFASTSLSVDSLSNFITIFTTIYYINYGNTINAELCFDSIIFSNCFKARKTKSFQILTTALSKTLQSVSNFYSTAKSGFCTIYQNNKILLVLESDPKVNMLPLIGM